VGKASLLDPFASRKGVCKLTYLRIAICVFGEVQRDIVKLVTNSLKEWAGKTEHEGQPIHFVVFDIVQHADYIYEGCENVVIGLIGEVRCAFVRERCSNKVDVDNIVVYLPIFEQGARLLFMRNAQIASRLHAACARQS
jgi:hypothetical protein